MSQIKTKWSGRRKRKTERRNLKRSMRILRIAREYR